MELTIPVWDIARYLWRDGVLVRENIALLKCYVCYCAEELTACPFL